MTIAIIDYGIGNLRSVEKAFKFFNINAKITSRPEDILKSDKIVLPGVGAFPDAMKELKKRGLILPIKKFIASRRPYLGICLGLQLLFTKSEEAGGAKGLDIIHGCVKRFPASLRLKVPHIGWNQVKKVKGERLKGKGCPLFKGIPDNSYMYFVHSYYVEPEDKSVIAAVTDYGMRFASVIFKDNIFATQFHPEKSQTLGLKLIKNFIGDYYNNAPIKNIPTK